MIASLGRRTFPSACCHRSAGILRRDRCCLPAAAPPNGRPVIRYRSGVRAVEATRRSRRDCVVHHEGRSAPPWRPRVGLLLARGAAGRVVAGCGIPVRGAALVAPGSTHGVRGEFGLTGRSAAARVRTPRGATSRRRPPVRRAPARRRPHSRHQCPPRVRRGIPVAEGACTGTHDDTEVHGTCSRSVGLSCGPHSRTMALESRARPGRNASAPPLRAHLQEGGSCPTRTLPPTRTRR